MLLLYVMMTLIKLFCVNTAFSSMTNHLIKMEKVLAVVHEHDFNVTPAGDDDVQSYSMSLQFLFQ